MKLEKLITDNGCDIEQKMRDEALVTLNKLMINEKKWVLGKEDSEQEDAIKNLRIIWEGLFFGKSLNIQTHLCIDFWHSDKSAYQKDLAEKISKLFSQIGQVHGIQK
jgi:hypothetical protein